MKRALLLAIPLYSACITPKTTDKDDSSGADSGDDTSNPGGGDTIYDIQKGLVAEDTVVTLEGVVVTSPLTSKGDGFFIQDQAGGEYSGLYVFLQGATVDLNLYVGDVITITGSVSEYYDFTELTVTSSSNISVTGEVAGGLAGESLTGTEAFSAEDWEPWESVLVSLPSQTILGDVNSYGEVDLSGGVVMDNLFFDFSTEYGATYTSITGPMNYSFEEFKINPRDEADLAGYVAGAGPDTVTVCEIQEGQETGAYEGRTVHLEGVIASSGPTNSGGGFWISDKEGGEWCGVYVYVADKDATPTIGDELSFDASVTDYYELTELSIGSYADVETTGSGFTPVSVTLDAAPESWEPYEGVLVTLTNVSATSDEDSYGVVSLDFGDLQMDDDLYYYEVSDGDAWEALTGLVTYTYEAWKLIPRDEVDMGGTGGGGETTERTVTEIRQGMEDGSVGDGDSVIVRGAVATSGLTSRGNAFFMQDVGGGPWSGIYVYTGTTGATVEAGDLLTITAEVTDYYGLAELSVAAASDIVVDGTASPVATVLTPETAPISFDDWEPYESALLDFDGLLVTSAVDGYGQYTTNFNVFLDDCFYSLGVADGDSYGTVTGLLYLSYDEWKLCPRDSDDFVE